MGLYRGAQMVGWLAEHTEVVLDAGLGTQGFLGMDVVESPLSSHGGVMSVNLPVLDPAHVEALRASPERSAWWSARLERCLALL